MKGLCAVILDDWDPNSLKSDNWFVMAIVLSSTTVTIAHIGSASKNKKFLNIKAYYLNIILPPKYEPFGVQSLHLLV